MKMSRKEIQEALRERLVPRALDALEDLLDSGEAKAADIRLAFTLADQFGVDFENDGDGEAKPKGALSLLEGFDRAVKEG